MDAITITLTKFNQSIKFNKQKGHKAFYIAIKLTCNFITTLQQVGSAWFVPVVGRRVLFMPLTTPLQYVTSYIIGGLSSLMTFKCLLKTRLCGQSFRHWSRHHVILPSHSAMRHRHDDVTTNHELHDWLITSRNPAAPLWQPDFWPLQTSLWNNSSIRWLIYLWDVLRAFWYSAAVTAMKFRRAFSVPTELARVMRSS